MFANIHRSCLFIVFREAVRPVVPYYHTGEEVPFFSYALLKTVLNAGQGKQYAYHAPGTCTAVFEDNLRKPGRIVVDGLWFFAQWSKRGEVNYLFLLVVRSGTGYSTQVTAVR